MVLGIFIIIPSILLSGIIFLLEAIPDSVRFISYLIPFTYFVEIIRGLLIKQSLFADLFLACAATSFFAIAFVAASISKFRKTLWPV